MGRSYIPICETETLKVDPKGSACIHPKYTLYMVMQVLSTLQSSDDISGLFTTKKRAGRQRCESWRRRMCVRHAPYKSFIHTCLPVPGA